MYSAIGSGTMNVINIIKSFCSYIRCKLVFLLLVSGAQAEEYIACKPWGQLGNQLFLISSTLGLAWDNNATAVFPDLDTEQAWNVQFNKEHIFFRLNQSLPETVVLKDLTLGFYKKIDYEKNIRLVGFDIRLDYFGHHQERLQELFSPSEAIETIIQNKYGKLLSTPDHVGMHIRVCANEILPFSGWDYYISAMNKFPDNSLFIVCSDRISWVKKHFPFVQKNIVFIDDSDHYLIDFFLLTKCKNLIVGGSTFGYWAAFLNKNSDKKVIVPSLWLSHREPRTVEGFPSKWNVYPHGWTVLPVPFVRQVPQDILQHKSTSYDW